MVTLKASWNNVKAKAKVTGRWHDNRHTLITDLAESGAGDETIRDIAGHVSKQMLKHYSHIRNLASRLRRLESRQIANGETRLTVKFADLKTLPRSYVGDQDRISKPILTPSWCSSCRARGSRRLLPAYQIPSADARTRGGGIKAVIRRLHQLERRHAPQTEAGLFASLNAATIIRERRRCRCEASGEPFEEMPPLCAPLPPGKCLSIAETLPMGWLRANQQNRNANSGSRHSCRNAFEMKEGVERERCKRCDAGSAAAVSGSLRIPKSSMISSGTVVSVSMNSLRVPAATASARSSSSTCVSR
jgi:Phage integrase family